MSANALPNAPPSERRSGGAPDSAPDRVTVPEATDPPSSRREPHLARTIGIEGWALNVSRGGVRVILEVRVELGAEYEVTLTRGPTGESETRIGRVVWLQDEPDGVVAGIKFSAS